MARRGRSKRERERRRLAPFEMLVGVSALDKHARWSRVVAAPAEAREGVEGV